MNKARFFIFLAVIILIINLSYFYPTLTGKGTYAAEEFLVEEVLDGDTFKTESTTVRLLCLNTPEKNKPYYQEAKDYLSQFEKEEVQALRDKEESDRYNRKLRFVFHNERFINKEIIEQGLAHLYLCEGIHYYSDLKEAEEQARKRETGIWSKSTSKCANCFELIELNYTEEYFIIKNTCDFECSGEVKDEANHFFQINLKKGEEKTITSEKIWNDKGDRLFLRDEQGLLLYYEY